MVIATVVGALLLFVGLPAFIVWGTEGFPLPKSKKKEKYEEYLTTLSNYKSSYRYSEIAEMDFHTVMSLMQVNPNKWRNLCIGPYDSDILVYEYYNGKATGIKFSYKDYKVYLSFLKNEQEKAKLKAEMAKKQHENEVARDILDDVQKDIGELRKQANQEIEDSTETMQYIIERM